MLRLAERQRDFAEALLDPARPVPPGLVGPDGEPCPKRFAVYRNNVTVALVDALADSYPAVQRLVGDDFFRAMAGVFVRSEPPRSPVLLAYGGSLADFIERFEPAAALPYLADVARIERAWLEAYHAAEAETLDPSDLAAVPYEQLGEVLLDLHPSLRIVRSPFPALTIWRMNVADGVPEPVELEAGEDTLILRPAGDVEVRFLPAGGAEFVTALAGGRSVSASFEQAVAAAPEFDLTANLVGLIAASAIVGFTAPGPVTPAKESNDD